MYWYRYGVIGSDKVATLTHGPQAWQGGRHEFGYPKYIIQKPIREQPELNLSPSYFILTPFHNVIWGLV
ncbi:hypothetical protein AAMO2058_000380800 [Amorphochlora amoebiformis]